MQVPVPMIQRHSHWREQILALRDFLPTWFPALRDVTPLDAEQFARMGAPPPLAEFYGMIGGRVDLVSNQNHFQKPDLLADNQGRLIFYIENQGVYEWRTRRSPNDPPVWVRETGTRNWEKEAEPLSRFLSQAAVFEAIMGAPNYASFGCVPAEVISPIMRLLKPLPFGNWRWPADGMGFYQAGNALATVCSNYPGRIDFWCAALQSHDLDFLRPFVTNEWAFVTK